MLPWSSLPLGLLSPSHILGCAPLPSGLYVDSSTTRSVATKIYGSQPALCLLALLDEFLARRADRMENRVLRTVLAVPWELLWASLSSWELAGQMADIYASFPAEPPLRASAVSGSDLPGPHPGKRPFVVRGHPRTYRWTLEDQTQGTGSAMSSPVWESYGPSVPGRAAVFSGPGAPPTMEDFLMTKSSGGGSRSSGGGRSSGSRGGGGRSGGGGCSGGGRGPGGWPSTTGNPSGGGRNNNPPRR